MTTSKPRPEKPTADFPLFAHASGSWAKKIGGQMKYFGPWSDPLAALDRYEASISGESGTPGVKKARKKPVTDFPLFQHGNGQWAKKIKGRTHYFGSDQQKALETYLAQKDQILAGQPVNPTANTLTIRGLVNHFLNSKRMMFEAGRLAARTLSDYRRVGVTLGKYLGENTKVASLTAIHFDELLAKLYKQGLGHTSVGEFVTRARMIFAYAEDPLKVKVQLSRNFKRPSKAQMREVEQNRGQLMFQETELGRIVAAAGDPLKAMILLGVNCGFGNTDCAKLTLKALDLDSGWVVFPRPKTKVPRHCPLWPETVKALQAAIASRPTAKNPDHEGLVFITARGNSWERKAKGDNEPSDDPVTKGMTKLLKTLGLHRRGLGFYSLRRTFETVGGESLDQVSTDYIMGHAPSNSDMAARYRQRVLDDRLLKVTGFVRSWLFKQRSSRSTRPAASVSVAVRERAAARQLRVVAP